MHLRGHFFFFEGFNGTLVTITLNLLQLGLSDYLEETVL